MVNLSSRYRMVKVKVFRNFRGRYIFRRKDEVECFERIYYVKKNFEVKTEWWGFSSHS